MIVNSLKNQLRQILRRLWRAPVFTVVTLITLAAALGEAWQFGVLAAAAVVLLVLGRGVVSTLIGAAAVGVILALLGAPLP